AGDEMVGYPRENLAPKDVQRLTATGFLRTAPDGTAGGDQAAANARIADTIKIVTESLMGVTVGCAQCHDHRYDPISQADYYRLRAIFEPAFDCDNQRTPKQRLVSLYTDADRAKATKIEAEAVKIDEARKKKEQEFIQQVVDREVVKLPEELREPIRAARKAPEAERTPEQKQLLKDHPSVNVTSKSLYLYDKKLADELKKTAARATELRGKKPKEKFVRALTEVPGKIPQTFLFYRGDPEQPRQELFPAGLAILGSQGAGELPANDASLPTTGRRLAFARKLTDGKHPLTARAVVNRAWMHHFGRGLAATPGDFGVLGERPTHPKLLDWLASEFMKDGWSLKRLHKRIMTSTVYRQGLVRVPAANEIDSDNRLLWGKPILRLEAEAIRDSLLAISGKLNEKRFGPPVPVMADRVGQWVIGKENLNAGRPGAVIAMKGEEFRRGVYVQFRRSRPLAVLDAFDLPAMNPSCQVRASSTAAPQSLMLMNGGFVLRHARFFAERVRKEVPNDPAAQVKRAWRLALGREPDSQEVQEALEHVNNQTARFRDYYSKQKLDKKSAPPDAEIDGLAGLCHVLFSANAFLYVD
ncbi:MAG: DUF1553 domain-containing protein, partial [Planctomycetales bacterium]